MRRHNGSGRFRHVRDDGQDINPMDGVANLADVMLVFACGLMLALITYWNVDVAPTDTIVQEDPAMQEITEDLAGSDENGDETIRSDRLQQYGTVYIDPETGQMYMVSEGE